MAILYRGHWSNEDTAILESAVAQLGSENELIYPWQTPVSKGVRHCVYLRKNSVTPKKITRAVGIPDKQPL